MEDNKAPETRSMQPLEGRAEEISGVVEQIIDRVEVRSKMRGLHKAIVDALARVGDAQGFTYLPSRLRFNEISASGRIAYVLRGKEAELAARAAGASSCGLKVGDVVIGIGRPAVKYRVTGFGRLNVRLERLSDGQGFLAKPRALEKVE